MVELTETERIKLLMMIGWGDRQRSLQDACSIFNETFPGRNISKSTASRLLQKLNDTGSVRNRSKSGRRRTATNDDNALNVLINLYEEPKTSVPKLALYHNTSERSVRRILSTNNFHPYKVQLVQELNEDDPDRRMQFCQEMMDINNRNVNFVNNIMFSDEATFYLNGFINRHNCRYWANENPHWMEESHTQHPQKLNVWAGLIRGHIIGPFFLRENLNAASYLQLLRDEIVPSINRLFPNQANPALISDDIWYQQDGAPPHYGVNVREYLNEVFPQRWIGRRGQIEWPPRSPDLSPLDFFLWGYLKSIAYKTSPQSLEDLEARIRMAVQEISPEMIQNSLRSFVDRLGYCQAAEGLQFEHLL